MATCGSGGFVKREGKTDEMNQIEPLQSNFFLALVAYTFLGPAAANPTKKSGHHELNLIDNCKGKSRMSPAPWRSISTRVEALAQLPGKVCGPVDLEMFQGKNVDIMRRTYSVSCGRAVERLVRVKLSA